jgi:predicted Zn finger-like uncharacterized protein
MILTCPDCASSYFVADEAVTAPRQVRCTGCGKRWPAGQSRCAGDRQLSAEPSLQDGHAALTISGVLRNIENKAVSAPPLRLSLLNPAGKRVGGKVAAAAYPLVPPGETRHFAIAILDPPSTAKDLEIGFVLDPGAAKVVKAAVVDPHVSAHLSLRGVTDSITVPPAEAIAAKSLPLDPLTPGAPIDRHSPA